MSTNMVFHKGDPDPGTDNPLQHNAWAMQQSVPTSIDQPLKASASLFGSAINWLQNVTDDVLPLKWAKNYIGSPTMNALSAVSNAGMRGWSTAALVTNPDSKAFMNLGDAWNAAQDVSPGQAVLSNPVLPAGQLAQLASVQKSAITGNPMTNIFTNQLPGPHGGIDPTDPAVRKAAFQSGGFGQIASGTTDAIFDWTVDPTVLAGAAAKPLIAIARGTEVATAANRAKLAQDLVAAGKARDEAAAAGSAVEYASRRAQAAAFLFDKRQDLAFVMSHPLVRKASDPETVASLISNSRDWNEYQTVIMAGRGDVAAYQVLANQAPEMAHRLNELIHPELAATESKVALTADATGKIVETAGLTDEEIAQVNARIKDVESRLGFFAKAAGAEGANSRGIFGAIDNTAFSPLANVNSWREATAARKAQGWGTTSKDLATRDDGYRSATSLADQPIKGGITVRVLNWAQGEATAGFVKVVGASSRGSSREVLATLRSANADAVTTTKWMGQYVDAVTASQREAVLERMQHELGTNLILQHLPDGYTAEQFRTLKANAEQFMDLTLAHRRSSMEQVRRMDGYAWDAETKTATKVPIWESDQAQVVPMTDFRLMKEALVASGPEGVMKMALKAYSIGDHALSTMSSLWKTSVLLRLGAMPKNVAESQQASLVFLGHFVGNPLVGSKNVIANKWDDLQLRALGKQSSVENAKFISSAMGPDFDVTKMTLPEAGNALQGKVAALQGERATEQGLMARYVEEARGLGGEGYYARAPELGTPVTHADIQAHVGMPGPEVKKGKILTGSDTIGAPERKPRGLTSKSAVEQYQELWSSKVDRAKAIPRGAAQNLRPLHAKAGQAYLREQQALGKQVVVKVNGEYRAVSNVRDIAPETFLPHNTSGLPEPDIFVMDPHATGTIHDPAALADIRASADRIAAIDSHIGAVRDDLSSLTDLLRPAARRQAGERGVIADIMRKNVSAQERTLQTTRMLDSRAQYQAAVRRSFAKGGTQRYDVTDPNYFQGVANYANTKIQNSPVGKMLLAGEDPAAVAHWMWTTDDGQASLHQLNAVLLSQDDTVEHLAKMQNNLHALLPDPFLRRKILQGEITEADVAARLKDRTDLIPVFDDQALAKAQIDSFGVVNGAIDAAFKYIWTLPEDKLARIPLYNALNKKYFMQSLHDQAPYLQTLSDAEQTHIIEKLMKPAAREKAQADMRRVVYSPQRRMLPAEKLRYVSPFLQVTANRLAFYGSQILENPQNMARLFHGYDAMLQDKDANGNRVALVAIPGFVKNLIPGGDSLGDFKMQFGQQSLNLVANSDPWWSPGFGPAVALPLAHIMRNNTNMPVWATKLVGSQGLGIFPNNYYGQNDLSLIEPTIVRRVLSSKDEAAYGNSYSQIFATQMMEYNNGLRDKPPSLQEIQDRTNVLWMFRIMAAETLPAQPQMIAQKLQPIADMYRTYQQTYGKDADAHFLADHPESYQYAISLSQNTGSVLATNSAYNLYQENKDLAGSLTNTKMIGLLTNTPSDKGVFDPAAYSAEYGQQIRPGSSEVLRGPRDSTDAYNQRLVSLGWTHYQAAVKERDARLAAGGFHSVNSKGAEVIQAIYKLQYDKILKETTYQDEKGNPVSPWFQDFSKQDRAYYANNALDLTKIASDPKSLTNPATSPWIDAAAQYVTYRKEIADELERRKAGGGSGSITAKENAVLNAVWNLKTAQLKQSNPAWADVANRFFARDDLTEVPSAQ